MVLTLLVTDNNMGTLWMYISIHISYSTKIVQVIIEILLLYVEGKLHTPLHIVFPTGVYTAKQHTPTCCGALLCMFI